MTFALGFAAGLLPMLLALRVLASRVPRGGVVRDPLADLQAVQQQTIRAMFDAELEERLSSVAPATSRSEIGCDLTWRWQP